MKKLKETKGITLIALVVTIVVLLILAGVSINLILNNNGGIAKAKDAKEQQTVADEKDQISLAYAACRTGENYLATTISSEEMESHLRTMNPNATVTLEGDALKITFTDTQHKYTIAQNGEIGDFVDWNQLEPGLYETGTANMIKSWEELLIEMYGEDNIKQYGTPAVIKRNDFDNIKETGDLIISPEITQIYRYGAACGDMTTNDKITGVYIPKETNLDYFGYGFSCFLNLKKVVYGEGCTTTGSSAFWKCSNLTDIILPDTITSIGYQTFAYCTSLKKVEIPESVTLIELRAFSQCTSLEEVIKGDNIEKIEDGAFGGTVWDNNITEGEVYLGKVLYAYRGEIPENTVLRIREGTKSVAPYCAYENSGTMKNLVSIIFPDGLESIGDDAFSDCYKLNTIILPKSLKKVGKYNFDSANSKGNLKNVNYKGTEDEWKAITMGEYTGLSSPTTYNYTGE